jgi:hypothetical protein
VREEQGPEVEAEEMQEHSGRLMQEEREQVPL